MLGAENCLTLIDKVASRDDFKKVIEARRQVAEVHAGLRMPPADETVRTSARHSRTISIASRALCSTSCAAGGGPPPREDVTVRRNERDVSNWSGRWTTAGPLKPISTMRCW